MFSEDVKRAGGSAKFTVLGSAPPPGNEESGEECAQGLSYIWGAGWNLPSGLSGWPKLVPGRFWKALEVTRPEWMGPRKAQWPLNQPAQPGESPSCPKRTNARGRQQSPPGQANKRGLEEQSTIRHTYGPSARGETRPARPP